MEITMQGGVSLEGFKNFFLKAPKPFISKREADWNKINLVIGGTVVIVVLAIMLMPTTPPKVDQFHVKAEKGTLDQTQLSENDPTLATIKMIQESQVNLRQVHGSLDYLYRPDSLTGGGGSGKSGKDRSANMILGRDGVDTRTQLTSGTRIKIRLSSATTIANQGMPVIGIVSQDVSAESGMAIPSGSKVLGDASFDESTERASIIWRSIIFPDGRERPFSAVGISPDGQVGIAGNVQSDGLKNAIGQTITRFIGAYAAGSMSSGALGANEGGHSNGVKNAVAQTATDRANAWGEDMKQERKWIELQGGQETFAVLNQPFQFRDPGTIHGR